MIKKGKYIVFEGGEGLGKTTSINDIIEVLKRQGYEFIYTREPGGVEVSEKLREIVVNNEMDPSTETLIYAASRCEHIRKKVIPLLNQGKNIISDRSFISSLVYQSYVKGEDFNDIIDINDYVLKDAYPDLVIIFDAPPSIGLNRIDNNPERERNKFDNASLDFHEKVRDGYLNLVTQANMLKTRLSYINASKEREERIEDILQILKENEIIKEEER